MTVDVREVIASLSGKNGRSVIRFVLILFWLRDEDSRNKTNRFWTLASEDDVSEKKKARDIVGLRPPMRMPNVSPEKQRTTKINVLFGCIHNYCVHLVVMS